MTYSNQVQIHLLPWPQRVDVSVGASGLGAAKDVSVAFMQTHKNIIYEVGEILKID